MDDAKRREPSCTMNHDVQRRELRDKGLGKRDCPVCGWTLSPARPFDEESEPDPPEAPLYFTSDEASAWASGWSAGWLAARSGK